MSMAFIIVVNDRLRHTLETGLRERFQFDVHSRKMPDLESNLYVSGHSESAWVMDAFRELSEWMEGNAHSAGGYGALRGAICIVDFQDPNCAGWSELNPLESARQPMVAVASMLILLFPEVRWILNTPYYDRDGRSKQDGASEPLCSLFQDVHVLGIRSIDELVKLQREQPVPLFDPTGLRQLIRRAIWNQYANRPPFPSRNRLAAAVDEEQAYSYFNAYAAYRLGFRVWAVSTWRMMNRLLNDESKISPVLVFEDLYLNFGDRPADLRLSDLEYRDKLFPILGKVPHRVLVTGGASTTAEQTRIWEKNKTYLEARNCVYKMLWKPVAGLHKLMRDSGRWEHNQPLLEKSFVWPPDLRGRTDEQDCQGHSAPGRVLLVASKLLDRGRQLLSAGCSVIDATHAAVLAMEAKELLAGQTPTTALDALQLQYEAEVVAESMFMGVEHNIDTTSRFKEIDCEVANVCMWFHGERRGQSARNAGLTIAEQLARQYQQLNQIEEELASLTQARRLRLDFYLYEKPFLLRCLLFVPIRYLVSCLSSLRNLAAFVLLWVVAFGAIYANMVGPSPPSIESDLVNGK